MSFVGHFKNKKILVTGNTGFKGSWLSLWLHILGAKIIGVSKDVPTIPSHYKLNNKFYPYVLVQDKKDLKFSNLENKQIVKISNNHLQYAVTWFVLAIGIIIAFWFYKRK